MMKGIRGVSSSAGAEQFRIASQPFCSVQSVGGNYSNLVGDEETVLNFSTHGDKDLFAQFRMQFSWQFVGIILRFLLTLLRKSLRFQAQGFV